MYALGLIGWLGAVFAWFATKLWDRTAREGDWRSFNVARSRADELFAEHRAQLLSFLR